MSEIKNLISILTLAVSIATAIISADPVQCNAACTSESTLYGISYIGACDHNATNGFTLTNPSYVTWIRIWYDTSLAPGGLSATMTGPNGYSKTQATTLGGCDPFQYWWCEGRFVINSILAAGSYSVTASSGSVCANPSGDSTLYVYGCTINPPTGLAATSPSPTQILLTWNSDSTASYNVYRNNVLIGSPNSTRYLDSGRTAATSYSYTVAACDGPDGTGFCTEQTAPILAMTQQVPEHKGTRKDNPDTAYRGQTCSVQGWPTHSVNTATLNLVVTDTDLAYSGLGPAVSLTRTWNSDPSTVGMFGRGWSFPYESKLFSGTQIFIFGGAGQGTKFSYAGETLVDGTRIVTYTPETAGNFDSLTGYLGTSDNYWLYTRKDTRMVYRYDISPNGTGSYNLTSITDRNGNSLIVTYNSDDTIASIVDAAGRTTAFAYDANKRCTTMTVPGGRTLTYTYDNRANLTGNVDLLNTAIMYTYDGGNFMTSMTVDGRTTSFTYDASGGWTHVASVTDPNGHTESYTVVTSNDIAVTDANSNNISYTSSAGKTTSVTGANSSLQSRAYTSGLPTTSTDANGNATTYTWDARGNMLSQTDPLNNTTMYVYDANDFLVEKTNALGQKWFYTRDARGNITVTTSPTGKKTVMTYNDAGQLTTSTDPMGNITSYTYDGFGNLKTVTKPLGGVVISAYDNQGINLTSLTDELGNVTLFTYDGNGRPSKVMNPDGTFRTMGYSACALTSMTDEAGRLTQYGRDKNLQLTQVTDPLYGVTTNSYDFVGNLLATQNPLSQVSQFTYDTTNRRTSAIDPLNATIGYSYDNAGNLTLLTDERNNQTSLVYDVNNLLDSVKDPLNTTISYAKDALKRVTTTTNARGGTVGVSFTPDGWTAGKTFGISPVATFNYDDNGNLTSMVDNGTTTFTYNKANRLTSITWPDTKSVTFSYDLGGNLTGIIYPGGLSAAYVRDNRNRVQALSWDSNTITYTYDGTGRVLTETNSNGTNGTYVYDSNGRLQSIRHKKGDISFAEMIYYRDPAGNIYEEYATIPLEPELTDYQVTATHNGVNQLLSRGSDSFTYDTDGNLTAVSGDSPFSATYDNLNRPTGITARGITTNYTYDGLGSRTSTLTAAQTRKYHYDLAGHLLFETDESGTILAYYLYNDSRLAAMKTGGASYFYHFDKTGNTIALTDTTGSVVNAYAYEPYGRVANSTGTLANPFTYVGAFGVMDEKNGIYFMKNRYYDSVAKRFIQKDPIGFASGQTNLYSYVGGNPVSSTDPAGLFGRGDPGVGKLSDLKGGEMKKAFAPIVEAGTNAISNALDTYIGMPTMPHNNLLAAIQAALKGDWGDSIWNFGWNFTGLIGGIKDFMELQRPIDPNACPGSGDWILNMEKQIQNRPGAYRAPTDNTPFSFWGLFPPPPVDENGRVIPGDFVVPNGFGN